MRVQTHRSAGCVWRIKYSTLSRSGSITSVSCTEYSALIAHNIQFVRVYNVRTTVCLKWMLQEKFYWAVITFHDKKKNPVHRTTILVSKFVICTLLLVMDITKILNVKQESINNNTLKMHVCHTILRTSHAYLVVDVQISQSQLFSIWWCFTFWVPCCDVRYDSRIKAMFSSSLPLKSCLIYVICVCLRIVVFNTLHILRCFFPSSCCQFLWIVHFWLPLRYSRTFML